MAVPDTSTEAGQAYVHAQSARAWLDSSQEMMTTDRDACREQAKAEALVSIAESLAVIAANQTPQIPSGA